MTASIEKVSATQITRTVSFGSIEVRQYERILDICGLAKGSVGLTIGWAYVQDHTQTCAIPVLTEVEDADDYDSIIAESRRSQKLLPLLLPSERLELLNDYGFTLREILEADKLRKMGLESSWENTDRKASYFSKSTRRSNWTRCVFRKHKKLTKTALGAANQRL
jgi:hypothetical protein